MTDKPVRIGLGIASLAFLAYVSLGLPDGLLGVAWPSMRQDFGLPLDSLGPLFIAFTIGYLSSSFFAGRLTAYLPLGTLLALSTLLAGGALVGYGVSPSWWAVVSLGILAGFGGGGIDATLNIYVATHHGPAMMQWLHATYGVGATLGPVVMTLAIGSLGSWRWGYLLVGGFELALAACFASTVAAWNDDSPSRRSKSHFQQSKRRGQSEVYDVPLLHTLREWRVWLSMLLFFVYMGIEVAFGTWAYTLLTESRGVSFRLAGFFMASYWGIFTVGRTLAGFYARRVSEKTIVLGSLIAAILGTVLLSVKTQGVINLVACAVIGLSIAPLLAALLSGTAKRVGKPHAANTIGVQIAAMGAGAAVVPSLTGVVAQRLSLEAVPLLLLALILLLGALYLSALATKVEELSQSLAQ